MHVSSQSTVLAPARLRGGFGAYRGTTAVTRRNQLPRPPRPRTTADAINAPDTITAAGPSAPAGPSAAPGTIAAPGSGTTAPAGTTVEVEAAGLVHPFVD